MTSRPRQQRLVFAPQGIVDLGAVGAGGSNSHFISINGRQHVGKCPSRANGPWVCFNEFLAARLATRMGLPIPAFQVVHFQGPLAAPEQWFCSERMMPGGNPVSATYANLTNADQIGGIVVLDLWLCNTDRSPANLWAQHVAVDADRLFMIDHGHTLLTSGPLNDLAGRPASHFLRCADLLGAIRNANVLAPGIEALEGLGSDEISDLIDDAPAAWTPDRAPLPLLKDFLVQRRDLVRGIIEANLNLFPNLKRNL